MKTIDNQLILVTGGHGFLGRHCTFKYCLLFILIKTHETALLYPV
jgi:hypothetical protein